MEKTVAMRLLEGKNVPYEALTYPATERDAVEVARHLGVAAAHLFKTLVVVRERGKPLLVLVPADCQLDLKRLAKELGEKKVKMASHEEAERLTRLQVGGISPLALINRGFDVIVDRSAEAYEVICVSAGAKGIQLKVPVPALLELTRARLLPVTG